MPRFRITKTARAEQDLDDIWFYIAVDNVDAADAVLDAIDKRCHLLVGQPMMGKARPELGADVRSFGSGRYVIFYVPSTSGIVIVRVLHASRDLGGEFGEG